MPNENANTDFFVHIGKVTTIFCIGIVFGLAMSVAVFGVHTMNDRTPAFTIQPEASTVTTAPDGTHAITRKLLPDDAHARK